MGEILRKRLAQSKPMSSSLDEALMNVMVAAGYVRDKIETALKAHDLTLPQYNVLRILRGAYPNGHPRCDIARRMIERAPDVTRLIDRLEERKLVERDRSQGDRRLSITRITKQGLDLLSGVDVEDQMQRHFTKRISPKDRQVLSRILESIYEEE